MCDGAEWRLIGLLAQAFDVMREELAVAHRAERLAVCPLLQGDVGSEGQRFAALWCWPNRAYSVGSTKRFSRVDVNRPPTMTTAIGYSIS